MYVNSVLSLDTANCKVLLYDVAWNQTDFESLLLGENYILLECAANICVLKLQDADHAPDAEQTNPTCAQ